MINIQPISELRNYNSILDEVKEGQPVYLTKNGKGMYAIVDIKDIEEYQSSEAFATLLAELQKGEKSGYVDEKTFNERFNL
ncbi:MAG: type II toxin-antitoxin system prevent-host-death family antitoxin [Lachnospiraceae bacterium]|nr:type II toxin-antitoxin system prevent-host-death family antitoxin [Lachnospiraceae bacterium]